MVLADAEVSALEATGAGAQEFSFENYYFCKNNKMG